MTEALKPSELFGLPWRSLDDQNGMAGPSCYRLC